MPAPRITTVLVERAEALEDALIAANVDPALVGMAHDVVTLTSYADEGVALAQLMFQRGPESPKLKRRLRERWRVTDLAHARALAQARLPLPSARKAR